MTIPAIGKFEISVIDSKNTFFVLDAPGAEGYVIGRSDSKSNYIPDIDLNDSDGLEKGVSRRHAVLVHSQGSISVIDLASVNGTFLNDSRLEPHKPYELHAGDELILGTLPLIFHPKPE
ncbi:MAG: FHA domain-containing protein [Anaerolineae bacterium]|nr:FHA domain-containing protein [Anaerolineae bacterium]